MRTGIVAGLLVLAMAMGTVGQSVTSDPFPGTFDTNPSGAWALYSAPEGWTTVSQLSLMTSAGAPGYWKVASSAVYPCYNQYNQLYWSVSEHPSWSDAAVCVYTCPRTGGYSLNLAMLSRATENIFTNPARCNLWVGVATDPTSPVQILWSKQQTWTPSQTWGLRYDDLSTVPELQGIFLPEGAMICFCADAVTQGNYSLMQMILKASGLAQGDWAYAPPGGSIDFNPITKVPVNGVVNLAGYLGDKTLVGVRFDFIATVDGDNTTRQVFLNSDGSFTLDNITMGTYEVRVQASGFLTKVLHAQVIDYSPSTLDPITLTSGDSNGDDGVTFEDFSILQNAYGQGGELLPASDAAAATGLCSPLGAVVLMGIALGLGLVQSFRKDN